MIRPRVTLAQPAGRVFIPFALAVLLLLLHAGRCPKQFEVIRFRLGKMIRSGIHLRTVKPSGQVCKAGSWRLQQIMDTS